MNPQLNKRSAQDFLQLVIGNKVDEAYEKYVDMNGKHHNAFYPGDMPTLRDAMKENGTQFPNKQFIIKNVLSDGDLVAVHSHLILKHGDLGMVAVHLFRFKDNKIVEMWDC